MFVVGTYLSLPSIGLLNVNKVATRFLAKFHETSGRIEQVLPERCRLQHCFNFVVLPKAFIHTDVLLLLRTSPLPALLILVSSSSPSPLSKIVSHIRFIVIVGGNLGDVVRPVLGSSTMDGKVNRIIGTSTQRNLSQSRNTRMQFLRLPMCS